METFQSGEELAAKDATQDFDGQEERIARAQPSTMIQREPAGGNDTVNVGMQEQVLSPGVQDGDHANLGSEVLRIGCDFQQGLRSGGEQQIVKQAWVLQRQHIQFVRHSEHDMEIAGVEEIVLPCCDPALTSLRLTLGAVAIATRVVGDGLIPAALTGIAMAAEGSGAAALNGSQGFELLVVQARSIPLQKAIALHAQDVGHLEGGPSHEFCLRWY